MRRFSSVVPLAALVLTGAAFSWMPSAGQGRSRPSALEAFNLRKAVGTQVALPKGLLEVSGLAVTAEGRVIAHGDERAIISILDGPGGTVQRWFSLGRPPMRGDFEGIATVGPRIFLMTSQGILHEGREGAAEVAMPFTSKDTGFGAQCELEGLAYDARAQVLLLPCKTPLVPAGRGRVTVFRWSVSRAVPADPPQLSVPLDGVTAHTGTKAFHPSAIDVDPVTGNYLLVAGPERAVLELTSRGEVVGGVSLPRKLHKQPEGIAFVGDSLLLIGDEGGTGRGTLTTYRRAR
ncbi:MAG: hypothetical protein H7066_07585 [Cytophagaceae bacterium]|nr:hypothetical protein [Gemmatimonadaceae bacterium]